jgi:hypothetical protein
MGDNEMNIQQDIMNAGLIYGSFSDLDGRALYETSFHKTGLSGYIIETGSGMGKSSAYLGLAAREKHEMLICIDSSLSDVSSFSEFMKNIKSVNVNDSVIATISTSENFVKVWNNAIKLLFINGKTSFNDLKREFYLFDKYVLLGGFVCIHGVDKDGKNEVVRFISSILADNKYEFLGVGESVGILKKIK